MIPHNMTTEELYALLSDPPKVLGPWARVQHLSLRKAPQAIVREDESNAMIILAGPHAFALRWQVTEMPEGCEQPWRPEAGYVDFATREEAEAWVDEKLAAAGILLCKEKAP